MWYRKRNDAFTRMTNKRYAPDTDYYCAICGGSIYWPSEAIDFNEKGEICHPECLENATEEYGTEV